MTELNPMDIELKNTALEELGARVRTLTKRIARREEEVKDTQRLVDEGLAAIVEMKRLRNEYDQVMNHFIATALTTTKGISG